MKTLWTIAVMGLFCGIGCNTMTRTYHYRVVVANLGDQIVTANRVFDSTGEYNYGCGHIGPAGYKTNAGPMETAPNDVFTVRWTDEQQREHEQKFDLRNAVKRHFKGEIVFVYGPDNKLAVEIWDPPHQYPIPPRPSLSFVW